MIIKTLEEAIEVLKDLRSEMEDARDRIAVNAINMVLEAVKEPKCGEWVRKNNSNSWFECSVCKEVSDVVTIMREPTWQFCPNCGSDNRKKEGEV